jgi:hypothetical protein
MAGETLDLDDILVIDDIGEQIANNWITWNIKKQERMDQWSELKQYIYATDTTHTSNSKLPWSNKTTIPKLCQIRDNLNANYIATLFPKRRWLEWEGNTQDDASMDKQQRIKDYMMWAVSQRQFKEEIKKAVLDYIDYGNCFVMPEWDDETESHDGITKSGYSGPRVRRIDPNDICFNPVAASFANSPKIIRSLMSIGEAKETIERLAKTPEDLDIARKVFEQCMELRNRAGSADAVDTGAKNALFNIAGFDSFQGYLTSDYVELLTFMGDLFDRRNNKFYKNHMIVVMDRHKVILNKPHPYPQAEIPIYHAGWRTRQENLWAMGPLDNLIGMQYRLDHVENMKADLFDLITFPPVMVKGLVADFEWAPMERIYVDNDGAVELMSPQINTLNINLEIERYETLMEEMAGSPKEAMGFRTPGEKTAYEVQRLENAASRVFQNKIAQFEEQLLEPLLNGMLILAKKYMTTSTIRTIDDKFGAEIFVDVSQSDLAANGRLKPVAARHFAEKAERIQNLTSFFQSPIGMDPMVNVHFSGVKTAQLVEDLLDIEEYDLVTPYVRISEQAEAAQLQNTQQEQVLNVNDAPSGLTPDDASAPIAAGM